MLLQVPLVTIKCENNLVSKGVSFIVFLVSNCSTKGGHSCISVTNRAIAMHDNHQPEKI